MFSTVYKEIGISINMYPTGDKYQSDKSLSICHLGDLNDYKSKTSISISYDIYVIWET